MITPAGAAITIALPKTNIVLSIIEVYKTLPNFGFLYGGNSNVKLEGMPLRRVLDNKYDTPKVIKIPKITINETISAGIILDLSFIVATPKNTVVTRYKVIG